ncbi:MAG: hypothetical protein OXC68_11010 [Aestuariivita sp.]|nr:hypothetical protein [Aestuariivita sp.]
MTIHAFKPEQNAVIYTVDARDSITPLQRLLAALLGVQAAVCIAGIFALWFLL